MKKKKFFTILVAITFFILALGYLLPAILITDGTEKFQGDKQAYAKDALELTEMHLSTPSTYKLWITQFKVVSVEPAASEGARANGCMYDAIVQGYSYFGLKSIRVKVGGCGGVQTL